MNKSILIAALIAFACSAVTPAQESMLQQLRVPLAHKDRYVQQHGEVW